MGRLPDLVEVVVDRILPRHGAEIRPGAAENGGEQVVEVVGDAVSQAVDGLHFLRLLELLLKTRCSSVTSVSVPTKCVTTPWPSRIGEMVRLFQNVLPSLR